MTKRCGKIQKNNTSVKRKNDRDEEFNKGNAETKNIVVYKSNIDRCKYLYDLVNMWIANTDSKVSSSSEVLSVVFALFSFVGVSIYGEIMHEGSLSKSQLPCLISLGIGFLLMSLSLLILLCSIVPNVKSNSNGVRKKCPVFYGDICKISKSEDYESIILKASDADFVEEMIREIHYNSGVCYSKTKRYSSAVKIAKVAILFNVAGIMGTVLLRVLS